MAKNHEGKVYAGGIRNRINRVVVRTGEASLHYNSNFTDQNEPSTGTAYDPRSLVERTTKPTELNVQRSRIDGVKENDV